MTDFDKKTIINILNKILGLELAGVLRYTHYSLMVFGYTRIPIVSWLRAQAQESLDHAQRAGELVTHFGGHPSLEVGELQETQKHEIGDILAESMEHERQALSLYQELLAHAKGGSIVVEEYAREMILAEDTHLGEVDKMLRKPGDTESVR
ncbi:MAG: ferritin-like domain-containing protein [Planctomycetota bacterium]|jgi:bacterioferritin